MNWGDLEGKCGPTLSVARSETWIHNDLVDSLDGEDASKTGVDVRENGHDCSPDQSAVVILRGLYKIIRSSMVDNCTDHLRRTGRLRCTCEAVLGLGVPGIQSVDSPSGELCTCNLDTGEGVMIENYGDTGIPQPLQTFLLQTV